MDWLTQKEIKKAAETSLLAAVRCSKKHWWQLATATESELVNATKKQKVGTDGGWCALCEIRECDRCPLADEIGCAGRLWDLADAAYWGWRSRRVPHSDFTKAARKLHKRLYAEERKLLAKAG